MGMTPSCYSCEAGVEGAGEDGRQAVAYSVAAASANGCPDSRSARAGPIQFLERERDRV